MEREKCKTASTGVVIGPTANQVNVHDLHHGAEGIVKGTWKAFQNKKAIVMGIINFARKIWLKMMGHTNSDKIKSLLKRLVYELDSYQEKIDDNQTTDCETNSTIEKLHNHLVSVYEIVRYHKASWVNINCVEILSMISKVMWYFTGICRGLTRKSSDQKIKDLLEEAEACEEDIKEAIGYFETVSHFVTSACVAGGIITGVLALDLLSTNPVAAAAAALCSAGFGVAGYITYDWNKKIEKLQKDGEEQGKKIVDKSE